MMIDNVVSMVESSIVLYDGNIIDFNKGNPCQVEFNFERVWRTCKSISAFEPTLLDFVHVHNKGFGTAPSTLDINCMMGLNMAFEFFVYFHIVAFDNVYDKYNTYCEMSSYRWDSVNKLLISVDNSKFMYPSEEHLIILKILATGGNI